MSAREEGIKTLLQALPPSDAFVFVTVGHDRFDARYHVPRSQVWEGSGGRQRGHVHLHVRGDFDLGRIHRKRGQALCGKRGWYERGLEKGEIQTACPRCAAVARRLL